MVRGRAKEQRMKTEGGKKARMEVMNRECGYPRVALH